MTGVLKPPPRGFQTTARLSTTPTCFSVGVSLPRHRSFYHRSGFQSGFFCSRLLFVSAHRRGFLRVSYFFFSISFVNCYRSFPCNLCLSFPRRHTALVSTFTALGYLPSAVSHSQRLRVTGSALCLKIFFWCGQVKSCCASPVRLRLVALRFLSRTSELMCPCRWVPPFTASSGQTLQCPLCLVALLEFVLSDFVARSSLEGFPPPKWTCGFMMEG